MENDLTIKQLEEMKPGLRFATGTGNYPELSEYDIRWVAVRGDGMADWCIYYHHLQNDVDMVAREGDKCFTKSVIKRLVPCDDETYGRYRR